MTRLPEGKHALTPNLVVKNGRAALDFYADPGKTGLELSALNRIEQVQP